MKERPPGKTEPARSLESELEEFRVRDETTIRRILSDLARHNRQATIYFNTGEDFLLSAIIGYDPKAKRLYLDYGTDEKANQNLLHAAKRVAVSSHNQVPVRFTIGQPVIVRQQGYPAFMVAQPKTLIRMQRRAFFRVATPVARPLICHFVTGDGLSAEATVVDISLGGMALIRHPRIPPELLVIGNQIPSCRIELPGQGVIEAGFVVCNLHPNDVGSRKAQIGCQFLQLNARMMARLQRYIHKLELARLRISESSRAREGN